ncbi:BTAD domain-containing putative transcriptional regulator [Micromonospora sp. NPDC047548]|uniref:BTAD domain-containing putative transcriptional regulator n=1 Tax=Micromonospora sp. NPDC047548 TaxID=3155624 RepID=UPI0033C132D6
MSAHHAHEAWRPSTRAPSGRSVDPSSDGTSAADLGPALRRLADAGDRKAGHLWLVAQPDLFAAPGGDPAAEAWRDALRHHLAKEYAAAQARLVPVPAGTAGPHAVQVHCFAAVHHLLDGDLEQAAASTEEAVRLAGDCLSATAAQATVRFSALLAAARGDETVGRARPELTGDLDQADAGLFRLMIHLDLADHALTSGGNGDALRHAEAAIRLTEVAGLTGYEPYALSLGAATKCQLGRLEEALADGAAARRLRELAGIGHDEAYCLATLGMVHRRRRETRQARQSLEAALAALDADAGPLALRVWILAELARVRAADDLTAAEAYAERAVAVAGDPHRPYALLARGWVALLRGDTTRAHHDAAEARTGATVGRRRATLIQALQLIVLAAPDPRAAAGLLDDAAALSRETGDRAEEAAVRLIAARLRGRPARRGAEGAEQQLRRCGVRLDVGVADGLTAMTLRVPAVVIHTLGDFRVFRAGALVPYGEWQSKKARDLLKILVAQRGRAVPRIRLMELLWPDESPSRTANRLSVLLSTLRRVLGTGRHGEAGAVLADRGSVAIDLDVVDVDVEAFLTAAEEAQAAQRAGQPDAARLLARADELYGGDFLADDPYEDWAQPLRDEAQAAHTSVLRALAQHAPDTDQKLVYLMRLVHRDPYDEDTHLELVQVLQAAGRHGEAQRRYRAYVDRMRELGIRPSGGLLPGNSGGGRDRTMDAQPGATALPRYWSAGVAANRWPSGIPSPRAAADRRSLIGRPA